MAETKSVMMVEVTSGADTATAEVIGLAVRLRSDLLKLDVDTVELLRGQEPPPGTKALDSVALGRLLIHLARSPKTIARVVKTLQSWLLRDECRRIVVEMDGKRLELSHASPEDQERLILHWMAETGNG